MKMINVTTVLAVCFGSFVGVASMAHAVQPIIIDIEVHNDLADTLQLTSASWSLGDSSPSDFAIMGNALASMGLPSANERKGQVAFSYSTPNGKSCLFSPGHDIKQSFGWFKPIETPIQWAKGKSQGAFLAACSGTVLSNVPGKGYKVKFVME
jgi:hypothetical protein